MIRLDHPLNVYSIKGVIIPLYIAAMELFPPSLARVIHNYAAYISHKEDQIIPKVEKPGKTYKTRHGKVLIKFPAM